MKTNFFIIGASTLMLCAQSAPAAIGGTGCYVGTVCSDQEGNSFPINAVSGCATTSYSCYGTTKVASCVSCSNTKATRTRKTINYTSNCSAYYYTCECTATCSDCTSDTSWSSAGTAGYEKKVTATCDCGTCTKTTSYRCAAGYYGMARSSSSGCTKCPSSGGVAGQSAVDANLTITQCYIPSGSAFSDSTGSGTYTGNCYYSN